MADIAKPIYRDAEKPDAAVPVTNGCASPGAATTGDATASPIPVRTANGATLHGKESHFTIGAIPRTDFSSEVH